MAMLQITRGYVNGSNYSDLFAEKWQRTRPYQRTPQIPHGKERTPTIHQGLPSGND